MLLTLTTTHRPASDLGYLLHKNPARQHVVELAFGPARVFYPEASEDRCTAALLLEVDPVGLVRNRRGPAGEGFSLEQYVNDRPYAASSFLSVAISQAFGTALGGRSRERPELAAAALPLVARLPVVPCRGGDEEPEADEAAERALFGCARPQTVVVTTPNVEYKLRHRDGRAPRLPGAVPPHRPRRPHDRPADADGGLRA